MKRRVSCIGGTITVWLKQRGQDGERLEMRLEEWARTRLCNATEFLGRSLACSQSNRSHGRVLSSE